MDKTEVIKKLRESGDWNRHKISQTWVEAFSFYTSRTGRKLKPGCNSCYNTLKRWLKS